MDVRVVRVRVSRFDVSVDVRVRLLRRNAAGMGMLMRFVVR
jgi:hypothetical protein